MRRKLHLVIAIIGACSVFAPDLAIVAGWLASRGIGWVGIVSKAVGALALLLSNWDAISGRIKAAVDKLDDEPITVVEPKALPKIGPETGTTCIVTDPKAFADITGKDKGATRIDLAYGLMLAGMATLILWALFLPLVARAEPAQEFGGCTRSGKVCFGPSATITVGQFNLNTSKFSGGVIPGVGYGLTYEPAQWYATGLALYASFMVGQGQPNQLTPSLMFSFANYVRLGAGLAITEQEVGPTKRDVLLFFGLGSDFGGSPRFLAKRALVVEPQR